MAETKPVYLVIPFERRDVDSVLLSTYHDCLRHVREEKYRKFIGQKSRGKKVRFSFGNIEIIRFERFDLDRDLKDFAHLNNRAMNRVFEQLNQLRFRSLN